MLRNLLLWLFLSGCFSSFAQKEKLSYQTIHQLQKLNAFDSITVSITYKGEIDTVLKKIKVLAQYPAAGVLVAKMKANDLKGLLLKNEIIFINSSNQPKEELTTGAVDFTLNKIYYAQNKFPSLTGDSINTVLKERWFDTTDIDLRSRIFKTGLENTSITAHASLMATIIAGAGNSSPFARGAAASARVGSTSFVNLLPDADSVFQRNKISVQNHSYGTTVENFYGAEALAYDVSANNNPTLIHIFSAGNSGNITNTTGVYAQVTEMANLSGNFKQAKNIITVSATDSLNEVMPLSAKGPAYDGRVKPELVAYGEDGSSGAAALVSGAAVLVQDAYKRTHGGNIPLFYVTKAALINSADDVAAPNIDYTSGYGSLNASKAIETVLENRIIESSVGQNEIKSFSINVPANLARLKITLVWNDVAAAANAPKALVNDLDGTLRSNTQSWLPWVLNPVADKDSLLLPAQRKTDTLNNVEQFTVDNPAAGTYIFDVKGTKVTTSGQAFAITYQFDTANVFKWTYPTATDPLLSDHLHTIRWETTYAGSAQLSYTTNGSNWNSIAAVTDVSKPYYKWALPDTVTMAVLKMTIGANNYLSDTFTISKQPLVQVGFNCVDSFLLYWNAMGVHQFQLYELRNQHLQALKQTTDTSIILHKVQHSGIYYAVTPLVNNRLGFRSNTLNYTSAGAGCYLRSFYLQSQTANTAYFFAELSSLFNVAEVSFLKVATIGYTVVKNIVNPSTLAFSLVDSVYLHRGENKYVFRIKLLNGLELFSPVEIVYVTTAAEPVIVYPNPVAQNSQTKIIAAESGRYTIRVFDINGKIIYEQMLNSSFAYINTGLFAKGVYIVQVVDKDGKQNSKKLIVY